MSRRTGSSRVSSPRRTLSVALPAQINGSALIDGTVAIRLAAQPARWLLLTPATHAPLLAACTVAPPPLWQRLAIAAGEPQVHAATSEEFVAQMLNLDALDAIDFDKGCYTGQEVIARAHYRGRVKRRMQRFVTSARWLQPGDAGELADGRPLRVVDAVALPDGGCEFLAVTALPGAAAAGETPVAPRGGGARIDAQQLTLPYPLPP